MSNWLTEHNGDIAVRWDILSAVSWSDGCRWRNEILNCKGGLKISHCDKNIERANQIRLINQKISAQSLASVQSAKTVMFEEQKLELANLDDFS